MAVVTVTWTQAEVDALKAAIASGVLSVEYDGPPARRVQYQSLAAMRELLAAIVAESAAAAGTRVTVRYAAHRKGFYPGCDE